MPTINWFLVLEWGLLTFAFCGAALALRAAAAAVRMAQLALAHAHQHAEGTEESASVVLHTGNGHVVPVPDQAPDAEIDAKGDEWLKQFGTPDSWRPWEEQR